VLTPEHFYHFYFYRQKHENVAQTQHTRPVNASMHFQRLHYCTKNHMFACSKVKVWPSDNDTKACSACSRPVSSWFAHLVKHNCSNNIGRQKEKMHLKESQASFMAIALGQWAYS